MMDAVITYVNGLDPLWREDYERTVGKSILEKRFRDWGTLKYLLRGIEKNLPEVRNVYLVVARESQVPDWADRSKLKIVLHSDMIPEDLLPVFNSSSIEMFLHRIEGLSERFLYFNDDFFPLQPMSEEYFYPEGKAALYMKRQLLVLGNDYRYRTRKSCNRARMAAGKCKSPLYLRPQHTIAPFFKSVCEGLYSRIEDEIIASVTPVRTKANFNQYLFSTFIHFKEMTAQKRISNKHFSLRFSNIEKVCDFVRNPGAKVACINDVEMPQAQFEPSREKLLAAFDSILKEKSRFEL